MKHNRGFSADIQQLSQVAETLRQQKSAARTLALAAATRRTEQTHRMAQRESARKARAAERVVLQDHMGCLPP